MIESLTLSSSSSNAIHPYTSLQPYWFLAVSPLPNIRVPHLLPFFTFLLKCHIVRKADHRIEIIVPSTLNMPKSPFLGLFLSIAMISLDKC